MSQDTPYSQCDQSSIQRITALVDAKIEPAKLPLSSSKKHSLRITKMILITGLTLLSLSTLAFATGIDLPQFLKQAYNQLFPTEAMASTALNYMQPLEGSSIFNGIKAELIGYIRDNDILYITFSLQDLEGDRLDENTFIYEYTIDAFDSDYIAPDETNKVYGYNSAINILHISPTRWPDITLVSYDATTKTAIFNYRFSSHDAVNALEDGSREFFKKLQFTINLIASGAKEGEASIDLSSALTITPPTLEADFDDFRRNGYTGSSKQLQTFLVPDVCQRTLLNVPGVVLSNYGIIDNRLHVLIKYERPRDVSINRILDMSLRVNEKVWDPSSEVYLKDGEYTGTVCRFTTNNAYYAEYILDLPEGYTADDLEVVYHYRTYDYIIGMEDMDFWHLQESEKDDALWQLSFNPSISLNERAIPFKIISNKEVTHNNTSYISSIGLMLPEPPDSYCHLYHFTFKENMPLTLYLEDGTVKTITINDVNGFTDPDKTGKTKFFFSEFVDITKVKEIVLTLP